MCRYNISIDDTLMGKVRSTIVDVEDEEKWLQEQVTLMLMQMISQRQSEETFKTDEQGRIILTEEMKADVLKAEQDYAEGRCLTQAEFEKRFARWL
ncbi:MAG: hypothetical protein IJV10_04950 [Prevotella sp.]|nr:hypothetical protein [Prevotella sp.]